MLAACCKPILASRQIARVGFNMPSKGWSLNAKGYVIWTSRRTNCVLKRGALAHRAIVETLLGRELPFDIQVHHQDGNKLNCCPFNLIAMPRGMNPSNATRDPYTGEYMSKDLYVRRYGLTNDWPQVWPELAGEVPF